MRKLLYLGLGFVLGCSIMEIWDRSTPATCKVPKCNCDVALKGCEITAGNVEGQLEKCEYVRDRIEEVLISCMEVSPECKKKFRQSVE